MHRRWHFLLSDKMLDDARRIIYNPSSNRMSLFSPSDGHQEYYDFLFRLEGSVIVPLSKMVLLCKSRGPLKIFWYFGWPPFLKEREKKKFYCRIGSHWKARATDAYMRRVEGRNCSKTIGFGEKKNQLNSCARVIQIFYSILLLLLIPSLFVGFSRHLLLDVTSNFIEFKGKNQPQSHTVVIDRGWISHPHQLLCRYFKPIIKPPFTPV